MFQLREEHMQACRQISNDQFELRAAAHLRKGFPAKTTALSDDDLRARIRRDLARARLAGFSTERQLMRFVDSSFLLEEDFAAKPEHGWARAILTGNAPADERSQSLLDGAVRAAAGKGAP